MKNEVCMVEMCKSQLEIQVKKNTHRNIKITNEIICDCAKQQTAARKICHNVVWVFCIFSKWVKNDQLLPQTAITVLSFQRLLNKISGSIPNVLKIINDGVRQYNQNLWDHEKRDLTQVLLVSRNHTSRPSRSGYLQPN